MHTTPDPSARAYYAPQITTTTYEAPGSVEPVEIDIESNWGSWDAARGVMMTLMLRSRDRSKSWSMMLDLSLDQADEIIAEMTAAVAARRAHPPTAPERVLRAYNTLSFAAANTGGAWIDLADVQAAPELAGMDEAEIAAALAEIGDIELEAGPGPITVDGTAYTRMREIYPDRPSTT